MPPQFLSRSTGALALLPIARCLHEQGILKTVYCLISPRIGETVTITWVVTGILHVIAGRINFDIDNSQESR